MVFEFDPDKSASDRLKYGIDFTEAQELWLVGRWWCIATGGDETRYARIARRRDGNLWTAIYPHRGTNVGIISVRKASRSDRQLYEENIS